MQLDPTSALAEYPAAFVGTLVEVEHQTGPVFQSDADTIYRFEVETWVKGDLGEVVDIHSSASGASCGIEVGVGNRAGIFVRADGATLSSSLCETTSAEVLLAGAEPLAVGAPGPAVLLVSGNIGGFNYVVLNDTGEIVAGINGPDGTEAFEQPWQFSVCPGGNTLVEQWSRRLIVRDLAGLSVIREVDLTDLGEVSWLAIRCTSADGSSVVAAGEEWTGDRGRAFVYEIGETAVPGVEIPIGQVWLGQELALIQGHEGNSVLLVDYEGGEEVTVHSVRSDGVGTEHATVSSVAISPDDTAIAVLETGYSDTDGPRSTLIVYEANGQEVNRAEFTGDVWAVQWMDPHRILLNMFSEEDSASKAVVVGFPDLESGIEIENWEVWNPAIDKGFIYGAQGGTIVKADLTTGGVKNLSVLPTQFVGPTAVLPAEFALSPDLVATPESNTPNTVPPLISDAFGGSPAGAQDVTGPARVVLVALLFGVIAWIAFSIVNRRGTSPTDTNQS